MTRNEFKDYILNHNFTEVTPNVFMKTYEEKKFKLEYKVNKVTVHVYYHMYNRRTLRMKARLDQLKVKEDGSLFGFKTQKEN